MVTMPARVLAAADAYRTMTEPRPHRPPPHRETAGKALAAAASAGQLDPDAVAAVLAAAGQPVPRMPRPAGLTDRETQVIAMVARGLQTKQIGHRLGISTKTADRHLQNAYAKIGVSTRAAAAMFAMQHGLTSWGELPIPPRPSFLASTNAAAVRSRTGAEVVMATHRGSVARRVVRAPGKESCPSRPGLGRYRGSAAVHRGFWPGGPPARGVQPLGRAGQRPGGRSCGLDPAGQLRDLRPADDRPRDRAARRHAADSRWPVRSAAAGSHRRRRPVFRSLSAARGRRRRDPVPGRPHGGRPDVLSGQPDRTDCPVCTDAS